MLKVKPENSEIPMFINKNEVSLIKDSVIKLNKEEINALKELEDK